MITSPALPAWVAALTSRRHWTAFVAEAAFRVAQAAPQAAEVHEGLGPSSSPTAIEALETELLHLPIEGQ